MKGYEAKRKMHEAVLLFKKITIMLAMCMALCFQMKSRLTGEMPEKMAKDHLRL